MLATFTVEAEDLEAGAILEIYALETRLADLGWSASVWIDDESLGLKDDAVECAYLQAELDVPGLSSALVLLQRAQALHGRLHLDDRDYHIIGGLLLPV